MVDYEELLKDFFEREHGIKEDTGCKLVQDNAHLHLSDVSHIFAYLRHNNRQYSSSEENSSDEEGEFTNFPNASASSSFNNSSSTCGSNAADGAEATTNLAASLTNIRTSPAGSKSRKAQQWDPSTDSVIGFASKDKKRWSSESNSKNARRKNQQLTAPTKATSGRGGDLPVMTAAMLRNAKTSSDSKLGMSMNPPPRPSRRSSLDEKAIKYVMSDDELAAAALPPSIPTRQQSIEVSDFIMKQPKRTSWKQPITSPTFYEKDGDEDDDDSDSDSNSDSDDSVTVDNDSESEEYISNDDFDDLSDQLPPLISSRMELPPPSMPTKAAAAPPSMPQRRISKASDISPPPKSSSSSNTKKALPPPLPVRRRSDAVPKAPPSSMAAPPPLPIRQESTHGSGVTAAAAAAAAKALPPLPIRKESSHRTTISPITSSKKVAAAAPPAMPQRRVSKQTKPLDFVAPPSIPVRKVTGPISQQAGAPSMPMHRADDSAKQPLSSRNSAERLIASRGQNDHDSVKPPTAPQRRMLQRSVSLMDSRVKVNPQPAARTAPPQRGLERSLSLPRREETIENDSIAPPKMPDRFRFEPRKISRTVSLPRQGEALDMLPRPEIPKRPQPDNDFLRLLNKKITKKEQKDKAPKPALRECSDHGVNKNVAMPPSMPVRRETVELPPEIAKRWLSHGSNHETVYEDDEEDNSSSDDDDEEEDDDDEEEEYTSNEYDSDDEDDDEDDDDDDEDFARSIVPEAAPLIRAHSAPQQPRRSYSATSSQLQTLTELIEDPDETENPPSPDNLTPESSPISTDRKVPLPTPSPNSMKRQVILDHSPIQGGQTHDDIGVPRTFQDDNGDQDKPKLSPRPASYGRRTTVPALRRLPEHTDSFHLTKRKFQRRGAIISRRALRLFGRHFINEEDDESDSDDDIHNKSPSTRHNEMEIQAMEQALRELDEEYAAASKKKKKKKKSDGANGSSEETDEEEMDDDATTKKQELEEDGKKPKNNNDNDDGDDDGDVNDSSSEKAKPSTVSTTTTSSSSTTSQQKSDSDQQQRQQQQEQQQSDDHQKNQQHSAENTMDPESSFSNIPGFDDEEILMEVQRKLETAVYSSNDLSTKSPKDDDSPSPRSVRGMRALLAQSTS